MVDISQKVITIIFPAEDGIFYLLQNGHTSYGAYPASCKMGRGILPGGRAAGA
jgi:hypothetical protein